MKILIELFLTFARIGIFTFGGGYAALPLLERVIVKEKAWAKNEELLDYYAIAQCTPGIISVTVATFIGLRQKGVIGGVMATLGLIFPSFIIISLIAYSLNNFIEYDVVRHAFLGIQIAVCATVSVSIYSLIKKSLGGILSVLIFIGTFLAAAFLGQSPVLLVIVAGVCGVIQNTIKTKTKKGNLND